MKAGLLGDGLVLRRAQVLNDQNHALVCLVIVALIRRDLLEQNMRGPDWKEAKESSGGNSASAVDEPRLSCKQKARDALFVERVVKLPGRKGPPDYKGR